MELARIFENNREWIDRRLASDPQYFEKLARGQAPEILYIGCSDSRVTAEELMGITPGEAFIHRNIANVVPNTDLNSRTVIDYAVGQLSVKHIVVCGHTNCGGIKAAMQSENLGILNPWLGNIRDVYRLHVQELRAITDIDQRYDRLVELNVMEQCFNLGKIPEVQKALVERRLTLHGWVFDVRTGRLIDLNVDMRKAFEEGIAELYLFTSSFSG